MPRATPGDDPESTQRVRVAGRNGTEEASGAFGQSPWAVVHGWRVLVLLAVPSGDGVTPLVTLWCCRWPRCQGRPCATRDKSPRPHLQMRSPSREMLLETAARPGGAGRSREREAQVPVPEKIQPRTICHQTPRKPSAWGVQSAPVSLQTVIPRGNVQKTSQSRN